VHAANWQLAREGRMMHHLLITSAVSFLSLQWAPLCRGMSVSERSSVLSKTSQSSPHVGYTANRSIEVYVIGTSHFRCKSADEVATLIESIHPDGVVVELDPERTIRLSKLYAGFNEDGMRVQTISSPNDLLYGADFMSAINTCTEMDIPLFLGDEYAQETSQRLLNRLFQVEAYSPIQLFRSLIAKLKQEEKVGISHVDILQTFISDPQKITPLLITSTPSILLAVTALLFSNNQGGVAYQYDGLSSIINFAETFLSIAVSLMATSLLFNTVIVERDEILARKSMHAIDNIISLKQKKSVRKRWKFTVQNAKSKESRGLGTINSIPLFTLKTPLLKGAVRNLNLYEPREYFIC